MKVKKYRADTMPEVMIQVRKELGKDAVILQSKEVFDGGFLGMFKKKKIEVIAALDQEPLVQPAKTSRRTQQIVNRASSTEIMNEMKYLRRMVEQRVNKEEPFFESEYLQMYSYLLEQEIEAELAEKMVASVKQRHEKESIPATLYQVRRDTLKELQFYLSSCVTGGIDASKRVIQFIGPTGVGKTTTIAKIAAFEMMKNRKRVAFITTDTYRIAAVEQLKTYAKILDVPLEVAYSIADYKQAIEKFEDYDFIFVDTAGRNFLDATYVDELQRAVDLSENVQTFLVLSLTAKQKDLLMVERQFHHLPISGIIFTKLDETLQYGSLLTVPYRTNLGIAYLSNGQSVPDDLLKPDPLLLGKYILGGLDDE
ncbi:flagellar biosynthesis protein FlhF [Virgibacillus sp. 179-BFC.A HS]|uniref:Flagellar biosynthesis protein FlhF n=1 Tax=Tigheibacillus jepli TaxID=3035914 RepID=A0ABU5CHN4_9BACI|nr:flagellar biosynthesis protein FlhF [Virgibacillus sp. 179-BFC.A HS]MDY0405872.1 flagellar biosynthesis protein FlhF [Virgibacillus sp. 179-BFC.A HS]